MDAALVNDLVHLDVCSDRSEQTSETEKPNIATVSSALH